MDKLTEKTQELFIRLSDIMNLEENKSDQSVSQLKKVLYKTVCVDKMMTLINLTNNKLRPEYSNSVSTIKNAFENLVFYPLAAIHISKILTKLEKSLSDTLIYQFDFCSFWLSPEYEKILTGFEDGKYPGRLLVQSLKQKFTDLPNDADFTPISTFFKPFLADLKLQAKKADNFEVVNSSVKANVFARIEIINSNIDLMMDLIDDIYTIIHSKYEF